MVKLLLYVFLVNIVYVENIANFSVQPDISICLFLFFLCLW